jgi:hypothetical protein
MKTGMTGITQGDRHETRPPRKATASVIGHDASAAPSTGWIRWRRRVDEVRSRLRDVTGLSLPLCHLRQGDDEHYSSRCYRGRRAGFWTTCAAEPQEKLSDDRVGRKRSQEHAQNGRERGDDQEPVDGPAALDDRLIRVQNRVPDLRPDQARRWRT